MESFVANPELLFNSSIIKYTSALRHADDSDVKQVLRHRIHLQFTLTLEYENIDRQ